eukprot:gnl/Dysnectes_brevis/5585_a8100_647.p1 GENE.gnl/Dysnectes_brevis/5585_a8100_647~~gnl/Dysnectes_brevis/5585_a8100_647.p1  ORF type:complete len:188 (+),score=29.11 gnl/Dysnectes_brevis/5585_a8100_647:128-691(+)
MKIHTTQMSSSTSSLIDKDKLREAHPGEKEKIAVKRIMSVISVFLSGFAIWGIVAYSNTPYSVRHDEEFHDYILSIIWFAITLLVSSVSQLISHIIFLHKRAHCLVSVAALILGIVAGIAMFACVVWETIVCILVDQAAFKQTLVSLNADLHIYWFGISAAVLIIAAFCTLAVIILCVCACRRCHTA